MKIIIVGAGRIGSAVAEMLMLKDHDITIIDTNAAKVQNCVSKFDTNGIVGSGTNFENLQEANVAKADILIAVTGNDEINLLCCLLAKKAGTKDTIARISNPDYFDQLQIIKEDIGLSLMINPDDLVADEISRWLRLPSVSKVDLFAGGKVELVEIHINKGCPLIGLALKDFPAKFSKALICVIERGDEVLIPSGLTVIEENDNLLFTALPQNTIRFLKNINQYENSVKRVMIIGGGRNAFYLASSVISMGMKVTIIELDSTRARELSDKLRKADIIQGDGTDQTMLVEEGIDNFDAIVSLTGVDEENIIISMFAKSHDIKKVITKINKRSFGKMLLESLNLDSVITPHWVTADRIATHIRAKENASTSSRINAAYKLAGNRVEALEFEVFDANPSFVGIPLKKMKLKKGILIGGIVRGSDLIVPDGNTTIEQNDTVIIVTFIKQSSNIYKLSDILQ